MVKNLVILLLLLSVGCEQRYDPADMIIRGGKIYTVDDGQPVVEAVAVKGNKIIFVGSERAVERYEGENTRIIDLAGRIMTPGFIEGHGHIMGVGYNEVELDLMAVKSYDELVEQVRIAVGKSRPGEWIVGRGWHQDKWDTLPEKMVKGFQTHHALSAVSPDNPVFLSHASGHAALAMRARWRSQE